jgi:hypothetical protein
MVAYYPVFHLMGSVLKHLELLKLDCPDDPIPPLKFMFKREGPKKVRLPFDRFEVPPEL